MATGQEVPEGKVDILLGRVALERGLINGDQLREALAEQAAGVARGRKRPRRLGVILVEKHYLTDHQLLALLSEQESRLVSQNLGHQRDKLVGFLLIEKGMAERAHVLECLRIQGEAIEELESSVPRLKDLLVVKGYAKAGDIEKALLMQSWTILVCRTCLRQSTVAEFRPGEAYLCPKCKGPLETHGPMETLKGVRAPLPAPPAEAAAPPRREAEIPTVLARSAAARPPAAKEPAPAGVELPGLQEPPLETVGKYPILREVGRGAMGMVYEALDTGLNRKVALKLMLPERYQDPEEAAIEEGHFIREAQLIAKLPKHVNIVSVYAAGILDGKRYIAMEYVDGIPLSDWRKKGSVSIRLQVRVLRDVALAVHHAHEHGVIHRDLKPLNILVDSRNHACVTDFGLAKRLGAEKTASLTSTSGSIEGTPAYMSPEQARGFKKIDGRTDVYSLGVMLYETLAGRPPFQGSTPMDTLMKVVNEEVVPPSRKVRAVAAMPGGKALEAICLRAMAKPPRDRHPTAKAFADDLTTWLSGRWDPRGTSPIRRLHRP